MKIHVLHHLHLPITHGISQFLNDSPHEVSHTHLFEKHHFPAIKNIDWLIIMGGPMSANDESKYPYLASEKVFIKNVIDAGKTVLGICLGAQLIANALGANVKKNPFSEFGWHPVSPSTDLKNSLLADIFKQDMMFFHAHGETFDMPDKAIRVASSEACKNQGFIYDNRVVALQFHPEITPQLADLFADNCSDSWKQSPYYNDPQSNNNANELFNSSACTAKTLMQAIEKSIV